MTATLKSPKNFIVDSFGVRPKRLHVVFRYPVGAMIEHFFDDMNINDLLRQFLRKAVSVPMYGEFTYLEQTSNLLKLLVHASVISRRLLRSIHH